VIAMLLFFAGGIIAGNFSIIIPVSKNNEFLAIVTTTLLFFAGGILLSKSHSIKELNARGKPTTSIEIGQKYQVISIVISDEQKSEKLEDVCLLLQKDNEVIFYKKNKNETIITPEIGNTIILTKTGELVIIQKE
jgi:hypothetical protein